MHHSRTLLLTFLILANIAFADDHVLLSDGRTLRGTLTHDDGSSITLVSRDGSTLRLSHAELHPRTRYRLSAGRVSARDGRGLLDTARLALDAGLYAKAREHASAAQKADLKLESEVMQLRREIAEAAAHATLERAKAARSSGRVQAALELYDEVAVRYPDTSVAYDSVKEADAYRKERMEAARVAEEQRRSKIDAAARAVFDKRVAKIDDLRREAARHATRGLEFTKSLRASGDEFLAALSDYEKAAKELDAAMRSGSQDAEVLGTIEEMRLSITAERVRVHLSLAALYAGRQGYIMALSQVDKALALAPRDPAAERARARIELEQAVSSARYR